MLTRTILGVVTLPSITGPILCPIWLLECLYIRGEKPWVEKFQPVGGLEIEKPEECHFTPEIFSLRDKGGENDMDNIFFFRGTKSVHFFTASRICVGPTSRSRLTQIPRDCLAKNLTANQFFEFFNYKHPISENILKKLALYLVASSHFTLHPKTIKFKVWFLNNEPWPLCNFLHGFSHIV